MVCVIHTSIHQFPLSGNWSIQRFEKCIFGLHLSVLYRQTMMGTQIKRKQVPDTRALKLTYFSETCWILRLSWQRISPHRLGLSCTQKCWFPRQMEMNWHSSLSDRWSTGQFFLCFRRIRNLWDDLRPPSWPQDHQCCLGMNIDQLSGEGAATNVKQYH